MTKAQHTPGPWAAYRPETRWEVRGQNDGTLGASRFGALVAECFSAAAENDALLIAAAPDLLETLEYVLKAHDYDGALTMGAARLSPAIRDKIKREIDKARGE